MSSSETPPGGPNGPVAPAGPVAAAPDRVVDLLGVALWGVIYIGGGFAAGMGWREVAREYGEVAGAVLAVVLIAGFLLLSGGRTPFRRVDPPVGNEDQGVSTK